MVEIYKVSRRQFLELTGATGAALVLGCSLPGCEPPEEKPDPDPDPDPDPEPEVPTVQPSLFVAIDANGLVTVYVARSELGQGVRTSLPMMVAEELDADWSKVQALGVIAHPSDYGSMSTGGSTSVTTFWLPLRQAGATARALLLSAAAQQLGVDVAGLSTESGEVVHAASGQRVPYGDLMELAATLPVPTDAPLKERSAYRLLGTSAPRLDAAAKVDGSAQYGMDIRVEGMLFAVVKHCPVLGGSVASFDGAAAEAVAGVRQVVEIESGVAVVADSTFAALAGRDALQVSWNEGANASLDSAALRALLDEGAQQTPVQARILGNPEGALASAATRLDAQYFAPFLAHAPMEPMACVAHVEADRCRVWAPTQDPQGALEQIASRLDMSWTKIEVHTTLVGGAFGSRHQHGFVLEAVQVSQAVGAPVQLLWTRDDDMRHGSFRPTSLHLLAGGVDAHNNVTALSHTVVTPSISDHLGGGNPTGLDGAAVQGLRGSPYEVPNQFVGFYNARTPVPILWWRSVYLSQNPFAHECFLDELAAAARRDPVELRTSLLTAAPRLRGVVELAAQQASWGSALPDGHAQGVACGWAYGSYIAEVAEVSIEGTSQIRVHRVVAAVDCGLALNPDGVAAQIESTVAFGLSAALHGEITFAAGGVEQSNFHDYPVLRMGEMPQVEVHLVDSPLEPGGIGELGIITIAPAVANAVFAASGQRLRSLPLRLA